MEATFDFMFLVASVHGSVIMHGVLTDGLIILLLLDGMLSLVLRLCDVALEYLLF